MTLRSLLAKATGEEWTIEEGYGDGGGRHRAIVSGSEDIATGYISETNAALIVATHNCLGELLKVAECAEAVSAHSLATGRCPDDSATMAGLRAALRALAEKESAIRGGK